MFEAFSRAALLNPDEAEDGDDDWGGQDTDELIFDHEEVRRGAALAAEEEAGELDAVGDDMYEVEEGEEEGDEEAGDEEEADCDESVLRARLDHLESVRVREKGGERACGYCDNLPPAIL
jgi:hypothetical protein